MKPVIGLVGAIIDNKESAMPVSYVHAIESSGGIPVVLPYLQQQDVIDQLISMCDGFFFIGGDDLDPSRYGEEKRDVCGQTRPDRDEFEFELLEAILKTGKPVLGVCRGSQLINVAFGGSLYQDMLADSAICAPHNHDSVKILENTPLHALIGQDRMFTNTIHHQAVKKLGKGLEVMAVADDGTIEATYMPGETYIRAYQWHPERLCDKSSENKLLFEDFLKACMS